jgi:hypothetical protein
MIYDPYDVSIMRDSSPSHNFIASSEKVVNEKDQERTLNKKVTNMTNVFSCVDEGDKPISSELFRYVHLLWCITNGMLKLEYFMIAV